MNMQRLQRLRALVRRGAAPLAAVIAFVLGLWLGTAPDHAADHAPGSAAGDRAAGAGQVAEDTIWTCSMHPQIRQHEPGKCPICGMDLIPVSPVTGAAGAHGGAEGAAPTQVSLSETARVLARVRTAPVERRADPTRALHLLGRLDYDETRTRTVTAWTGGRIERLRVATTGQRIRAGQIIAELYSPEIYSAHQDIIQARRQRDRLAPANAGPSAGASGPAGAPPASTGSVRGADLARASADAALAAARQRLRLLGIPQARLAAMERVDEPARSVPVYAPAGGTVIERLVSEGDYVSAGSGLYRVADLGRLWVQLDAYERDLASLGADKAAGTAVTLRVAALPGETFEGKVAFVDPVIDPRTRTARVRVEVANPEGRLKPGMFAEAEVRGRIDAEKETGEVLVIPDTAPLFTGRRSLVYVELPGMDRPTYEAREVTLGPRAGTVYPVHAGLSAGEHVVVNGAFALDADLQIRGGQSMMGRSETSVSQSASGSASESESESASAPASGSAAGPPLEVPAAFRQALAPVMRTYLAMQTSLASDDLAPALDAAARMTKALDAVEPPAAGAVADAWNALAPGLRQHASHAAAAADLDGARQAFLPLSNHVLTLLERFGNPLDASLRVAYCPMAVGNQGGRWVQQQGTLRNSYFGAAMLTCGELRQTVEAGQHLPGAAHAPAPAHDQDQDHGSHGGHSP